ncbi:hypothetical protein BT96DRAFT_1004522 [Gymnopus androsaceus JB14]|uniref:Uncharacterized protein n=1 Tax=Gymnopus androsaceus JB14 TaxID=1447944 RepID=A0A6A4GSE6_9AGAR|nr:hypothetical protein BT96DRAFT_1004522 [Gymnopus androsaceus JB14]
MSASSPISIYSRTPSPEYIPRSLSPVLELDEPSVQSPDITSHRNLFTNTTPVSRFGSRAFDGDDSEVVTTLSFLPSRNTNAVVSLLIFSMPISSVSLRFNLTQLLLKLLMRKRLKR